MGIESFDLERRSGFIGFVIDMFGLLLFSVEEVCDVLGFQAINEEIIRNEKFRYRQINKGAQDKK